MRIGVASGKKQHYFELVRELERGGELVHYWNSLCFPDGVEEASWTMRRLAGAMRSRSPKKYETYRLRDVPAERVSLEPWTQLFGAAANKALKPRGWGNVAHNALFDRWVAGKLRRGGTRGLDLFHCCHSHSLHSGRVAQKAGLPLVIDQGAAHRRFEMELVAPDRTAAGGGGRSRPLELQVAKHDRELAQADYLVVASDFSKRTYVERGFPEDRVFVAPYGVDVDRFARPADAPRVDPVEADGVFRVLFIGGDQVRKGVPYLIDAIDRLGMDDVELVLVAPNAGAVEPHMKRAKCRLRHIEFLGHEELAKLIATCAVFVLPSLSDGFGMVVYEAMAAGLPAIVTTNVGAPVEDGVEGYVVPIRDADALAERVRALHADPDLRSRMGEAAEKRARRYTWANYAEHVRRMYRTILGEDDDASEADASNG